MDRRCGYVCSEVAAYQSQNGTHFLYGAVAIMLTYRNIMAINALRTAFLIHLSDCFMHFVLKK